MAVVVSVILRGVSPEAYDRVRAEVRWTSEHPIGGLGHITWWEGDDCHNLDAWESEEAFGAFVTQRLAPGMAKLGIDKQPEVTVHPAHEVFLPRAITLT